MTKLYTQVVAATSPKRDRTVNYISGLPTSHRRYFCMRIRRHDGHPHRAHRDRIRVRLGVLAIMQVAAAFLARILSHTQCDTASDLRARRQSIMVVRYACMGCVPCPSYFTTFGPLPFQQNSLHGIATVVLPNRPTNINTGGSGAANVWAGPRGGAAARPRSSTTGLRYPC